MKAIVHIGTPKTGTTAIQEFLFRNAAGLEDQGVHYHRDGQRRKPHFEFALAALSQVDELLHDTPGFRERYHARNLTEQSKTAAPAFEALRQYRNDPTDRTVVFSAEQIWAFLRSERAIRAMNDLFSGSFDDVRYIVYVRHPAILLMSTYSTRLRHEYDGTLDDFLMWAMERGLLHYHDRLKMWQDIVGDDRFRVQLYDAGVFAKVGLLPGFCEACGIDPTNFRLPERQNEAMSLVATEALSATNAQFSLRDRNGSERRSRHFARREILKRAPGGERIGLLKDQLATLDEATREDTEKVRQTFFPDRSTLFEEEPRTITETQLLAARRQATELLAELYAELSRNRQRSYVSRATNVVHVMRKSLWRRIQLS